MNNQNYEYDIALSFAGEQRDYVDQVVKCLVENKIKVYYDKNENLWGKDLFIEFSEVFYKKSKYVVAFISKDYADKMWTNYELQNIFARTLKDKGEYLLPVRFDDTEIPGLRHTIHYEDALKISPQDLCKRILIKLKKQIIEGTKEDEEIALPKIKRKITKIEKEKYIQESFREIANYFTKGLIKLETIDNRVKTYIGDVNNKKFIVKIYIDGDLKSVCKIWISYNISSNGAIGYMENNANIDNHNDNTYNDFASMEDDGIETYFRISMMGFGINDNSINMEKASSKDLAIYFWKRFIKNLN